MTTNLMTHRKTWLAGSGFAILGGAGILALALTGGAIRSTRAAGTEPSPPVAAQAHANELSAAFRYATEKVLPCVVTIEATQEEMVSNGGGSSSQTGIPDEFGPLLKRFFGDELPQFENPSPKSFRQHGTGSGVIIDPAGIILTNNHVAGGGGTVMVKLHDGREFTATEIKTDPKSDLAIVRIEGAGTLPAAVLGDSDALQIGDWVLAMGSPFGLDDTVTAGIISAKSRGMEITEREDFLQTDAAINPGNSGGPLVNLNGEVIGINTAISTRGGGSDGIGFAVPINLARWVSKQLVDHGSVERAFLGVGIQQVSSDLSKQFGLSAIRGALVTEVRPDTAAANAGLKVGDVIVDFDGHPIADPRGLQNVVEQAVLKDSHHITVMRDGQKKTLEVTLQAMPQTLAAVSHNESPAHKSEFNPLGLQVSNLSADVAKQLNLPSDVQGVVITSVKEGSSADDLGLKVGMVISRVGTKTVQSVDDFDAAVKNADLRFGLLLLVQSESGSRFVVLHGEAQK